jgi:phosphoribosyl 1,2-cyclic phosphodiesterase
LLQSEEEVIVLECGIPFLEVKKVLDFDISRIKCVLLTHEHADHSKYLKEYINAGIPICSSSGTLKEMNIKNIDGLKSGYWYQFGEFNITPFNVQHDCVEPFGFLIRHEEMGTILFATDSEYIRYDFSKLKIDHIAIECNYSDEIINSRLLGQDINKNLADRVKSTHMELETCKEFIKKNNSPLLKNVVLLHLSDGNSDARLFKKEVEKVVSEHVNVFIADKGLEIDVDRYGF